VSLGIHIHSTDFAILPGHDAAVLRHFKAWSKANLESPSVITAIARAKTVADAFSAFGFAVDVDTRGRLRDIELECKYGSWFHDLGELWGRISPHMERGASVTMETDEDGEDEPLVYALGGEEEDEEEEDEEEDEEEEDEEEEDEEEEDEEDELEF
jgi:hypothetical protein